MGAPNQPEASAFAGAFFFEGHIWGKNCRLYLEIIPEGHLVTLSGDHKELVGFVGNVSGGVSTRIFIPVFEKIGPIGVSGSAVGALQSEPFGLWIQELQQPGSFPLVFLRNVKGGISPGLQFEGSAFVAVHDVLCDLFRDHWGVVIPRHSGSFHTAHLVGFVWKIVRILGKRGNSLIKADDRVLVNG